MHKNSYLKDVLLFIGIVILLFVVVPAISSLLRQLAILQVVIIIIGAIALRYLVQKIRNSFK